MDLLIAIATDDGKNFVDRHFGDANYYDIFTIKDDKFEFVKQIKNSTEEEEEELHADPKKAKGITGLLKDENVTVVVSKVFGPNIKRIKKKFVCIVSTAANIEECKGTLLKNRENIVDEWTKGELRSHLKI